MNKKLIVTGMIGVLSFSLLTGAFILKADTAQAKETTKAKAYTVVSRKGKNNAAFRGMAKVMNKSNIGKKMFNAMQKQDYNEMRNLMQDPAVQKIHNKMHSVTSGMMGTGSNIISTGSSMMDTSTGMMSTSSGMMSSGSNMMRQYN